MYLGADRECRYSGSRKGLGGIREIGHLLGMYGVLGH